MVYPFVDMFSQSIPLVTSAPTAASLSKAIQPILEGYQEARSGEYSGQKPVVARLAELAERLGELPDVKRRPHLRAVSSAGKGRWAHVPWVSLLDERETTTAQGGVYVAFLFVADMSGVYLTLNQGYAEPEKQLGSKRARLALTRRGEAIRRRLSDLARQGFALDGGLDLHKDRAAYAASVIAHRLYTRDAIPDDAELCAALRALLRAYDAYLEAPLALDPEAPEPLALVMTGPLAPETWETEPLAPALPEPIAASPIVPEPIAAALVALASPGARADGPPFDRARALDELTGAIARRGFAFEPFQVAAYVTALRTKPFVILAGISGTGKSRLPALVAELTAGASLLLPVRPDWTDSADILGYVDLRGTFRAGALLRFARAASESPAAHHVCVVDEMNLARVEQYFAEVLSRIEDRSPAEGGGFSTGPLLAQRLGGEGEAAWEGQALPPNLALVGTVNMDETTHGFSRKVLDRAFTLEIAEVDLSLGRASAPAPPSPWPARAFFPRAARLGELEAAPEERAAIDEVVAVLTALNRVLAGAQLQVGYRVRDEVALFVLHAREVGASFVTRAGEPVDPLDLALEMKILPRIAGGSGAVRAVVRDVLGYAHRGLTATRDDEADALLARFQDAGCPPSLAGARFPRTAARLALMWGRLLGEGYTSYWL
jgi:5-methylcytosine-specific restriction enzyme B